MQKLDFPNRITVELTNQCNVSCTFCPRQSVDMKIGYMSMDLYKKIIDEASMHLPVKLVIFFRGESLLHPNFIECVKYAKEKGIGPIQYATNGYQLTKDISDELVKSEIDFVSFSLDTLDANIYKRTRMSGDLNVSMDNAIYLCEAVKKRREKGLCSPTIQVSTIEVDDYMDGQKEFIEFWKQYADIVRIYYEHDDNGKFRNEKIQKYVEEKVPNRRPCRKIFTDMLVYWDGRLTLCNYDWRGGIDANLNDCSITDAWNSNAYETIREQHNNDDICSDTMCKNCQHWRIDYMENGYLGKMIKSEAE